MSETNEPLLTRSQLPAQAPSPTDRSTQRRKILELLIEAHGGWVPLPSILALGCAQYNARIFEMRHELRRAGFQIENRIDRCGGKPQSWFRLIRETPQVVDKRKTSSETEEESQGELFSASELQRCRYQDPEEEIR